VSGLVILKIMLIAAVLFTFVAATSTIRYRITAGALEVLVMGMVARRVPFSEIEEVHRRGALLHESWSGPRFWNAVTIRRRRGMLRNFVISPDEPDRFVRRLQESLRATAGRGPEGRPTVPPVGDGAEG